MTPTLTRKYTLESIEDLDLAGLIEAEMELGSAVARVRARLESDKHEYQEGRETEGWHRRQAARSILGRMLIRVQQRRGELQRAANVAASAARTVTWERTFQDVARRLLKPAVYDMLVREATAEMEARQ